MNYREARAYIASLQKRGWRFGLDRMFELLRAVGEPHLTAQCLHVAGTNGKGSVTAMLASVLKEQGYKTGSFFSPYVYDFRERIQIDGQMISEDDITRWTEFLIPASERLEKTEFGGPTEFEFKTAMGFLHWQEQNCDFVALEVGLGGRLDATNVVTPLVSVITEIGLDHQEHLGNTIKEIAGEKAGIIKRNIPSVSIVSDAGAQSVISMVADLQRSQLWRLGCEITLDGATISTPKTTRANLQTNLLGSFQKRNMAAVCGALDTANIAVCDEALRSGLLSVSLPGRMEVVHIEPVVILDGAHNEQAANAVAQAVRELYPDKRLRLVYSSSVGHAGRNVVEAFASLSEKVYACEMASERAKPLKTLLEEDVTPAAERGKWFAFLGVADAVEAAIHDCGPDEIVLVTGSFFLLGEAKTAVKALQGLTSC